MEKSIIRITFITTLILPLPAASQTWTVCNDDGTGCTSGGGSTNTRNDLENTRHATPPGSNSGVRSHQSWIAEQEAKAKAKEAEKKAKCAVKNERISDAQGKQDKCNNAAQDNFNNNAAACTPVTKSIIQIDVSRGINVGVEAVLKKHGINIGAAAGVVVGGTLEFNPNETCRQGHKDILVLEKQICTSNFNDFKRLFADCPQ